VGEPADLPLPVAQDLWAASPVHDPAIGVAVWMSIDDPDEDVGEMSERIDVVELAALDQ
jgi:hypothetical protein